MAAPRRPPPGRRDPLVLFLWDDGNCPHHGGTKVAALILDPAWRRDRTCPGPWRHGLLIGVEMGVEATVVDKCPKAREPQTKHPRLAVIALRPGQEMIGPGMAGGGEGVITHDGMIVRVLIDPFDGTTELNREGKRGEAVFQRDDHLVDAVGLPIGSVCGEKQSSD